MISVWGFDWFHFARSGNAHDANASKCNVSIISSCVVFKSSFVVLVPGEWLLFFKWRCFDFDFVLEFLFHSVWFPLVNWSNQSKQNEGERMLSIKERGWGDGRCIYCLHADLKIVCHPLRTGNGCSTMHPNTPKKVNLLPCPRVRAFIKTKSMRMKIQLLNGLSPTHQAAS